MIKVIPVLDILDKVLVHAISGIREEYKPLRNSIIIDKPDPVEFLKKLKQFGFNEVYIADLNAIMYNDVKINSFIIEKALEMNFQILADIGIEGLRRNDTEKLNYVIGTEYLENISILKKLRNRVISLDIEKFMIKTKSRHYNINEIENILKELPVKKILVIFLDLVGTMSGIDIDFIKKIRNLYTGELIVGGGVKNVQDLENLKNVGVNGVLIATALHKGIITRPYY